MQQIVDMTRNIVGKTKQYESDTVPGDFSTLKTPCPKCGSEIKENYKKFQCTNSSCDFSLWRIVAGRQMEPQEIEELIANKKVGPLQGFKSKMGRPFAAIIKMSPEGKAEFDFGQEGADGQVAEVDFTGQTPIGKCPKCGGNVYEHGMQFVCEKATGPKKSCDFRTGKIILQRQIETAQVQKLLETGKTDLLHKFISKKGRPFSAFLTWDKEKGKVQFEFAPREPKAPKGKAKPKPAPTEPSPA
jgi:DNA topoisomerase-3